MRSIFSAVLFIFAMLVNAPTWAQPQPCPILDVESKMYTSCQIGIDGKTTQSFDVSKVLDVLNKYGITPHIKPFDRAMVRTEGWVDTQTQIDPDDLFQAWRTTLTVIYSRSAGFDVTVTKKYGFNINLAILGYFLLVVSMLSGTIKTEDVLSRSASLVIAIGTSLGLLVRLSLDLSEDPNTLQLITDIPPFAAIVGSTFLVVCGVLLFGVLSFGIVGILMMAALHSGSFIFGLVFTAAFVWFIVTVSSLPLFSVASVQATLFVFPCFLLESITFVICTALRKEKGRIQK